MPDVIPLYEDSSTGQLHHGMDGKAFYRPNVSPDDDGRPSLAGPTPRPGNRKGLGGSEVSYGSDSVGQPNDQLMVRTLASRPAQAGGLQPSRSLTAEELMALADRLEQDFVRRTQEAERPHSSSVEPSLGRQSASPWAPSPQDDPPQWLQSYMEKVPIGSTVVDMKVSSKYLPERQKLRELKALRDS